MQGSVFNMALLTKQQDHAYVKQQRIYQQVSQDADHIDIKSAVGNMSLNEFVAGMFNYQPAWMSFLYRVRQGFVRLLGMRQDGIPQALTLDPDNLNLRVGGKVGFFDIDAVESDNYLYLSAEESHLKATLGIIREPLDGQTNRYHAITIVHYKHWTGTIYFNVIRPFHHLVVQQMIKAGIRD